MDGNMNCVKSRSKPGGGVERIMGGVNGGINRGSGGINGGGR